MGVKVTAHNAPLPAVLLSCTQIYDEYRCSEVFRYMRMRVYATQRELIGLPEGCQTYMGRVGDLAGRVEGVDLVVEREGIVGYGEIDEEVWEALGKVVKRGLEMRVWFEGEI